MMRAQLHEIEGQITLQVCGRIAEHWVPELEDCWRTAKATHPDLKISVDLRGVTFIDELGQGLLARMHREGAAFLAGGLMNREIVDKITRKEA